MILINNMMSVVAQFSIVDNTDQLIKNLLEMFDFRVITLELL